MNIVNDPVINEIANEILDNKQFKDECKKKYYRYSKGW